MRPEDLPRELDNAFRMLYNAVFSVGDTMKVSSPKGDISALGAVPPTLNGNFGWTTTTTSITIYWDGTHSSSTFILLRMDGTQVSSPGSVIITGLTANTAYYFYPYWDEPHQRVNFAIVPSTSVGTSTYGAIAFTAPNAAAAQFQNNQVNAPINPGSLQISTPAAGTGGGSGGGGGGGGCPRKGMLVETHEGYHAVENLRVGMEILTRADGHRVWTTVTHHESRLADEFIRIAGENHCWCDMSPETPMPLRDDGFIRDHNLSDQLMGLEGRTRMMRLERVYIPDVKFLIRCEPHHTFYCGKPFPGLLTHNTMILK